MQVAYLGPRGSFSYMAARAAFPKEELLAQATVVDAIECYERRECDFALIPIENSIEGTVNLSIDTLFHRSRAQVVAELVLPISQNLLATSSDKAIEKVFSHPHALAQVRDYLREHYPAAQLEAVDSTAQAAELVKNHPDENWAAVATRESAEIYGLSLLAADIQDVKNNDTRFWLLGEDLPEIPLQKSAQKVSLALTLPKNLPGALHKAISVFAWRDIDMTKIESRPLKTALGQYFFIIDLVSDPKIIYALEELMSLGVTVRMLGDYALFEL